MSEPFLSEIKIVSFNFAPKGWALANGQLLPINQNQALFSLLGTTYGGDGQTDFALPDFRGRGPIHVGQGHALGERAGETSVTLSVAQLPTHTHQAQGANATATTPVPGNTTLLANASAEFYGGVSNVTSLHPSMVANAGSSQAHNNMMPYLTLNFVIALQGIYPSPN